MKIGITGTRSGLTDYQRECITDFLINFHPDEPDLELHHGDCIGADAQVAEIADELGYRIICHPPENPVCQANYKFDEIRPKNTYFKRNRNIVDECDILLVAPYQSEWSDHGGTWYTHDYAKKKNKPIRIFWPEEQNII